MASELKVNKITPESGLTLTLGDSGDTINFGSGVLPNFENLTVTGDLTVDTNSLKVDSTNNFVGIGTASPTVALDVVGAITATGNITGTLATAAQPNITSLGTLTGLTTAGNINLGDNDKILLGDSDEFQIWHTSGGGSNITETGTGSLSLSARDIYLTDIAGPNRVKIDGNLGDVSFYEDTGTTPKFFWDASAESLGIGTSSPSEKLEVSTAGTTAIRITGGDSNSQQVKFFSATQQNGAIYSYYNFASPYLALINNGSEQMRIDSSGNVGIGTTSPVTLKSSTTLQVYGNTKLGDDNGRGLLSLGDIASSGANVGVWRGAAGAYAGTGNYLNLGGYDGITFTTGNSEIASQTERMRIDSSGNVVIGSGGLDVSGLGGIYTALNMRAGSGYAAIYGQTTATTTNSAAISIVGATSGASAGGAAELLAAIQIACESDSSTNATGYMNFYTGSGGSLSEKMRIDSSGNVGIGTSSPATKTHIFNGSDNANILFIQGADTTTENIFFGVETGKSTITAGGSSSTNNSLVFRASNAGAETEYMRITNTGSVGIGTSSPDQLLHLAAGQGATLRFESTTTGATTGDIFGAIEFETQDANNSGVRAKIDAYSEGNVGNTALRFFTGTSTLDEAMRINSSGNVLVGTTNTTGIPTGNSVNVGAYISPTGIYVNQINNESNIYLSKASGYTYNGFVRFFVTGIERGSITTNGSSVSYNTSSDYRLKENVIDLTSATDRLKQLSPKRFNFIADVNTTVDGFLAHEVQSIVPEAIKGTKDEVDANGNPVYQGIDQSKLVPLLVASLQEALTEIDNLKARVNTLEGN